MLLVLGHVDKQKTLLEISGIVKDFGVSKGVLTGPLHLNKIRISISDDFLSCGEEVEMSEHYICPAYVGVCEQSGMRALTNLFLKKGWFDLE